MVKNVIFDMGNVLLEYNPQKYLEREGFKEGSEHDFLMEKIYLSKGWQMMDSGELDEASFEQLVIKEVPSKYHGVVHRLIYDWCNPIVPITGMKELIADLKNKGYGIYLISNASIRQPEYWLDIPGHELFDGCVVSALIKKVKPNPEIFRYALEKFGLKAEECLFVDDLEKNVAGAESVGIKGCLFHGKPEEVRNCLND